MASFYFYDFTFKDVSKYETAFPDDDGDMTSGNALARFISGKKKLSIIKKNKKGETESYVNNLRTIDGVSVLELSNKKEVRVVDSNQQNGSVESYPYVTIVIDNREGGQIIGIERRRIFDDNADTAVRKVAALLAENINNALEVYGKAIELKPVTTVRDIASVIHNRVFDNDDEVTSISFSFKPGEPDDSQSSIINDYIRPLNKLMGADGVKTELLYDSGGGDKMKKINHDLIALSTVLRQHQNYSLNINFKRFGTYRADGLLWAHFPIDRTTIDEFFSGTMDFYGDGGQTITLLAVLSNIKNEMTNGELWKTDDTDG